MTLKTVKVPNEIKPLFEEAESMISKRFENLKLSPESGQIFVDDERYVLVRAESLSVNFFSFLMNMYPTMDEHEGLSSSSKVLFDMGHSIGQSDAKCCQEKNPSYEPLSLLAAGPIHFAFSGWAFVEILESSSPTPDENYFLIYNHPHTFESDSWIKSDKSPSFCTCHMNAGYSSGWCSIAFGLELKSKEVLCRSKGDKTCRFIMAPPHMLEAHVEKYKKENPEIF
ncbi:MAG: hypothetical protein CME70_01745 [Halobacteriovorax sp.]|nr:hypothetical protein [Halobacteriovorax sp.]|tara:strand:- start:11593 stop:12270 length:678 start_codon:yes stop_codon:yes gene_type:complete